MRAAAGSDDDDASRPNWCGRGDATWAITPVNNILSDFIYNLSIDICIEPGILDMTIN